MTKESINKYIPGLVLCFALATFAEFIFVKFSFSSVVIAILLGFTVRNSLKLSPSFTEGITFSSKNFLKIAIVLMGLKLDFSVLKQLGYQSLIIIIFGMVSTILLAVFLGKLFKLKTELALLIGIGNAVCGNSAIAATKDLIGADEKDVGLSIAIINILGSAGMLLFPIVCMKFFHFSELESGILIGNTLQSIGQVLASAHIVGETALQTATIVKMVRILMLTPLIFILIYKMSRKQKLDQKSSTVKVPVFIIGFVLFSIIPTFKLLPEFVISYLLQIGHYSLVIAMAAIGLNIFFSSISNGGKSAFFVGLITFTFQLIFSSVLIYLLL